MVRKLVEYFFIISLLYLLLLLTGCSSSSRTGLPVNDSESITATETVSLLSETPTIAPLPTETEPSPTNTPTVLPTNTTESTSTPSSTPTETPFPDEITDKSGAVMVMVPEGEFVMGSKGLSKIEEPVHTVFLDSYYFDKFEVSNEQYAQFLNVEGNQFEGLANWIEANDPDLHVHEVGGEWVVDSGFEDYPMNEMTWYGARAFCTWRGARLPTEAEWEKAARGTDEQLYPWGEGVSCEQANYYGCNYALVPVNSYPESVSPYGIFNMAGNIMEWVNDWYGDDYYLNSPKKNPQGPETGTHKVFRGGSFINGTHHIRTTYRWPKLPVLTYVATGFRCARDAGPGN